jgi:cell division protein FtsI/penicillin-binding protein 2
VILNLQSLIVRRLLLLLGIVAVAFVPLTLRLFVLTVNSRSNLADARSRMERRQWLPTIRGRILDRKGRVMAEDRPAYDVAVDYRVISGEWSRTQARLTARRLAGRTWLDMSPEQKQQLADELLPGFDAHLDNAWDRLSHALGVPRAMLDEARGKVMAQVEARQRDVTAKRLEQELADAEATKEVLSPEQMRKARRRAEEPIAEKSQAHVLVARVPDAPGFAAQSLEGDTVEVVIATGGTADKLGLPSDRTEVLAAVPGLSVLDSADRTYPLERQHVSLARDTFPHAVSSTAPLDLDIDGVAIHLLGKLRDQVQGPATDSKGNVQPGDADRRRAYLEEHPDFAKAARLDDGADRGAYWNRDRVGDTGVEGRQENTLRGLRGLTLMHMDTGGRDTVSPAPGRDVHLTIDAALQARVQAVMDPRAGLAVVQAWHGSTSDYPLPLGTPLHGAAVVVDVQTGEVLAAVSTPTFSRERLLRDPDSIYKDQVARPAVNRALGAEYPPGSIVKPLILCGAVQRGVYTLDEHIACDGFLYPNNPNQLQCLIWKRFKYTHTKRLGHDPGPVEAIGVSCNIFFYTLGRRLGGEGLRAVYDEFGVTHKFGLGAGYEAPGQIGAPGRDITAFDATLMGIGQGPVTWSPLHAANAYATLARGGDWVQPRIVNDGTPPGVRSLNLDASAVDAALKGLEFVVNSPDGSGHHMTSDGESGQEPIFNAKGVRIWGKTGTAEAPDLMVDDDGDGPQPARAARIGDHSWFVVLAGADRPRFAVSVIIEYGGSGAKVSGPIANQIVHALQTEGYLP